MKNLNKNKGFTLAEMLIVIGIIGILGVIIIPLVQHSMPNQNRVMFKKAYNTLSEAISNMINDDVNYPGDQMGTRTDNSEIVPRGFNFDASTPTAVDTKFCNLLADQLNTIGTVSCSDSGWNSFTTSDGIYWWLFTGYANVASPFPLTKGNSSFQTKIVVDVNGLSKPPNCTLDSGLGSVFAGNTFNYIATCNNPDRFAVGIRYDGKLQVGCTTNVPLCTTPTDQNAINILKKPTSD